MVPALLARGPEQAAVHGHGLAGAQRVLERLEPDRREADPLQDFLRPGVGGARFGEPEMDAPRHVLRGRLEQPGAHVAPACRGVDDEPAELADQVAQVAGA